MKRKLSMALKTSLALLLLLNLSLRTASAQTGPQAETRTELVKAGSEWKFWHTEAAPSPNWSKVDFEDSAWKSGPAQLGYGDGDEVTKLFEGERAKPITAYFRRAFEVPGNKYIVLLVHLLRDDGAVVYINGAEVARDNMPEGPVTPQTLAATTVGGEGEGHWQTFSVPATALREGRNVIGVEVHQANASSSDLSFDLRLEGALTVIPGRMVVSIKATQAQTSEPLPAALVLPGEFTVARQGGDLAQPLSVRLAYGGTANSQDYEALPEEVVIPAGKESAAFRVLARADELAEGTETVIARIVPLILAQAPVPELRGYVVDPNQSFAAVRIADADGPNTPVVSLEVVRGETVEPSPTSRIAPGELRLRRTGGTENELIVFLTHEGTATAGRDYQEIPLTVAIPAGKAETEFIIAPLDDDILEGDETVFIRLLDDMTLGPVPRYLADAQMSSAEIVIHDNEAASTASLRMTKPRDGESLPPGESVEIHVLSVDPAGTMTRVEFFAGDKSIGVSEIVFIQPPTPGLPLEHVFTWQSPEPGTHVLTARSKDAGGRPVESNPVKIVIGVVPVIPVVGITVTDAYALELPHDINNIDIARFEVTRTGGVIEGDLLIYYSLHGSAVPGQDFAELPRSVKIPAGFASAKIDIWPTHDGLERLEPMETVAIRLEPSQVRGIIPSYVIDETNREAAAAIFEQNLPRAAIDIALPDDGSNIGVGEKITILTAAFQPSASVSRLDYFLDGVKIGSSEAPAPAPDANGLFLHQWEWAAVPAGRHILTAAFSGSSGQELLSNKVQLFIGDTPDLPTVSIRFKEHMTKEAWPDADFAPGSFEISRSGPTTEGLLVFFDVSGEAAPGADYQAILPPVLIPKGEAAISFRVAAIDDRIFEGEEKVWLTLRLAPPGIDAAHPTDYRIDPVLRSAAVVILDNDQPQPGAHIAITKPADGERLPVTPEMEILAVAIDPKGYIPRLEFFAGERRIGVSEITFIREPDPGTPITHSFVWQQPPPGSYTLTARGVKADGTLLSSAPVHIVIGADEPPGQVTLAIETLDPDAAEVEADGTTDRAAFAIKRVSGPSSVPVTALLEISGTAQNGIDYAEIKKEIVLPAGKDSVVITILPIPDKALEGDESVVMTLLPPVCPAIFPPPPNCYWVSEPPSAKAVIRDRVGGENQPPRVAISRPRDGAVFESGKTITIRAEASDRDGSIERLDIFAGEQLLGSTKLGELTVEWERALEGRHTLRARALDNSGAAQDSEPVRILVKPGDEEEDAFAARDLPATYAPGVPVAVALRADPPRGTSAYAVEDQPPKGWEIGSITDEGVFDPATGKVKFGPFTDGRERALSYRATPPRGAAGPQEFAGTASANGKSHPIAGDKVITESEQQHPADANRDFRVALDELTAYAASWKEGKNWENESVLVSYVTRAGMIWRQGEAYRFAAGIAAPLCWITGSDPTGQLSALAAASAVVRSSAGPERGGPITITLAAAPKAGISAYAVEEKIPAGWAVSGISHGGVFDAAARCIRWGVFFDAESRGLHYELSAPGDVTAVASLRGQGSFDGENAATIGAARVIAAEGSDLLHMPRCEKRADGKVQLKLRGARGQVCVLEVSTDLAHWTDAGEVFLPEGELDYVDENPSAGKKRYYRLRVR